MDQRSRRRRVAEMRELLMQWAEGEGVSTTALLGLLLYFDNWSSGDRNIARTGESISICNFGGGYLDDRALWDVSSCVSGDTLEAQRQNVFSSSDACQGRKPASQASIARIPSWC